MSDLKMIPDEALAAAARAIGAETYVGNQQTLRDAARAAIAAALEAWPGMHLGHQCTGCGGDPQIILPLTMVNLQRDALQRDALQRDHERAMRAMRARLSYGGQR